MIPILAQIAAGLFADWKASRENKRKIEDATTQARIDLAASETSHNQEWELRTLEGRDNAVRRFSFAIWSAPLIVAIFEPDKVREFFDNVLSALPDWYVFGYLGITGAIWGIAEMKRCGVIK